MNGRHILALGLLGSVVLTAGCAGRNRPATTQATTKPVATDIAPETASASYWFAQAPAVAVQSSSYAELMQECDHVLRQRYFLIDRSDYRSGLMVSKPLVSKQLWEVWRSDVGNTQQTLAASMDTYRRIVQWQVREAEGGGYTAVPHVVVERVSVPARRVPTIMSYRTSVNETQSQVGLTSSNLERIPTDSWYAIGRDKPLEIALAEDLRDRMRKHPSGGTLQRLQAAGGK